MSTLSEQLAQWDWKKTEPLHSLLCLPAVGLPLLLGVKLGYPGTGVLMAGGAQCVGFGSFQHPLFHRSGAMLFAAMGIAVSATVGTLCRDSTPALLVTTLVWCFLYGLSNSISSATAWVLQQCCVFLIVSSAALGTPGSTHDLVRSALLRGVGVLAGGMLQYGFLRGVRHWIPDAQTRYSNPDFDPTHFQRKFLLTQLQPGSGAFQYGLRMTVTGVASVALYRHMSFLNAYWIGMTAVLVPKPEWTQTAARGVLRTVGTLLGAGLCTLLVVLVHPRGEALTLLVVVFLFFTYLLNNFNYGAFALFLTGYICFILAIVRSPTHDTLVHRVVATCLGCGFAMGVHFVFIGGRRIFGLAAPHLYSLEERLGLRPHAE